MDNCIEFKDSNYTNALSGGVDLSITKPIFRLSENKQSKWIDLLMKSKFKLVLIHRDGSQEIK